MSSLSLPGVSRKQRQQLAKQEPSARATKPPADELKPAEQLMRECAGREACAEKHTGLWMRLLLHDLECLDVSRDPPGARGPAPTGP